MAILVPCTVLVTLVLADCGSPFSDPTTSTAVARQFCNSPARCVQLARQKDFESPGSLQVPSPSAAEFQRGWYVPPASTHRQWVFVFEYLDKQSNTQLQEEAFVSAGLHLKPCRAKPPAVESVVSSDGRKVCFFVSPSTGGSFVQFSQRGVAYDIYAIAGNTIAAEEQKDVLLGIVDLLRPV